MYFVIIMLFISISKEMGEPKENTVTTYRATMVLPRTHLRNREQRAYFEYKRVMNAALL